MSLCSASVNHEHLCSVSEKMQVLRKYDVLENMQSKGLWRDSNSTSGALYG